MTSVVASPLTSVLRAPVPLQVEISAQFLAGIAGTILLMLLFLMVVVLWDIALALRDVAEKIDYLEDDVDSDLATINGTLTRIYDRMGSGSGPSTGSEAAAGAPAGAGSTTGAGGAGELPVGAGGPAAATEAGRDASAEGAQTAGANAAAGGAPAGGGGTARGGRRRVASAPTAANADARTGDSVAGETASEVGGGAGDGAGTAAGPAPTEAETAPVDPAPDGAVHDPSSESAAASEESAASEGSAASTDSPASDDPSASPGPVTSGDSMASDGSRASAGPDTGTGATATGGATRADDGPAPAAANANAGRFASDGSGDTAWYDVIMDVARTASARDSRGVDGRDDDQAGAYGLDEAGLRAPGRETGGEGAGQGGAQESGPSMDDDDDSDGTPGLGGGETVGDDGSGVDADEVMQSDAVRDAYVDPVSAFGDDEFGPDRSQSDRRVSLTDRQAEDDESLDGGDHATDPDQVTDPDHATDPDQVTDPDRATDSDRVTDSEQVTDPDDPTAGDEGPVVEEDDVSPAVDERDGLGNLDDAGTTVVDEASVDAVESESDTTMSAVGESAGGEVADGAESDDENVDGGNAGDEDADRGDGSDADMGRSLAGRKERIRQRHVDEDGELDYESLRQEAAETDGVRGSGMPAEELLDALAAAAVHDETGAFPENGAVTNAESGPDVNAADGSIDELFDASEDSASGEVSAVEDALAERREETEEDTDAAAGSDPSMGDDTGEGGGIADLVNRELDTLTEEVGGTSMTPDVSDAELNVAVDELDDGSYTFPLSGSSFDVHANASSETATLSFTPEEPVPLDGARERLLKYQLRNYLDRDDTAHAELSVDGSTVHLDIPAATGPAVDAWADAAVQIIDRTLYLSKDED